MNELLFELKKLVENNYPELKCDGKDDLLGISRTKCGLPISISKNKTTNKYRLFYIKEVSEQSHYGLGRWCKSNFDYECIDLPDDINTMWHQLHEAIKLSNFERRVWDSWSVNGMEDL